MFGPPLPRVIRPACVPPTRNWRGWLSVVPRKLLLVVPALPVSCQAERFVNPPPLPVKRLLELLKFTALVSVPDKFAATVPLIWPAGIIPVTLLAVVAKMEYGTGVSCCLGDSAVKVPTPLLATPICSQLVTPWNGPEPKSIVTLKRPLVTPTPLVVTGPAVAAPPLLTLYSAKVRLYVPLAGLVPEKSCPWYMNAVPCA